MLVGAACECVRHCAAMPYMHAYMQVLAEETRGPVEINELNDAAGFESACKEDKVCVCVCLVCVCFVCVLSVCALCVLRVCA